MIHSTKEWSCCLASTAEDLRKMCGRLRGRSQPSRLTKETYAIHLVDRGCIHSRIEMNNPRKNRGSNRGRSSWTQSRFVTIYALGGWEYRVAEHPWVPHECECSWISPHESFMNAWIQQNHKLPALRKKCGSWAEDRGIIQRKKYFRLGWASGINFDAHILKKLAYRICNKVCIPHMIK